MDGAEGARRLDARVSGRVQGVGFRIFVVREARRLGLDGWVRNLPDGGVEVVAEGPESTLQTLEVALRRGPCASQVDRLDADHTNATGEYHGFDIRYD